LGFNRLAINDKGISGQQPYQHGSLVGVFNGEIYNFQDLAARHGLSTESSCDTHIVLPLYTLLGEQIIDEMDGFYSGCILDRDKGDLICLRDHIGKKPLLVGKSGSELFVTSELKALEKVDWFRLLPRGITRVDLETGQVELVRRHGSVGCNGNLRQLLHDAVRKRIPPDDEPLGLFLSGGLDSSIVAALASGMRKDIVYYTLSMEGAPDHHFAGLMVDALGAKNVRALSMPETAELSDLIEKVVLATESFNPSIISNGLCTYLLAEAAHQDGIKVVLTGEGADELFCGYHLFTRDEPWRRTRARLIDDMTFTELRRLDTCSMAHAVEARCPFLDRAVREFSDTLEYEELYEEKTEGLQNKMALRMAFEGALPDEVIGRRKTSFDVGSGARGQVVAYLRRNGRSERAELREIWRRLFDHDGTQPYFHAYPVFDHVIDNRGVAHR